MKILLICFTFLVKALPPSFHDILGIYIFRFTIYEVKIDLSERMYYFLL